jgi:hypothetical protein
VLVGLAEARPITPTTIPRDCSRANMGNSVAQAVQQSVNKLACSLMIKLKCVKVYGRQLWRALLPNNVQLHKRRHVQLFISKLSPLITCSIEVHRLRHTMHTLRQISKPAVVDQIITSNSPAGRCWHCGRHHLLHICSSRRPQQCSATIVVYSPKSSTKCAQPRTVFCFCLPSPVNPLFF